jgi:hypothetical protein
MPVSRIRWLRQLFPPLLAVALLTPGSAGGISAASPTGPVAATGVLKDKAGHGTAGRVYALAWPGEDMLRTLGPDDTIETPTVGQADTDRKGRFSIGVDDAAVPSTHRRRDGGLNLLLVGTDGSNEAMFFQPTSSPSQMSGLATDAATQTPPPSVTLTMNFTLSAEGQSLAKSARNSTITPNAPPPVATYPCHGWGRVAPTSLVWVSMGQSYSGPATNFAVLAQDSEVSNGTAFSASGTFGSWSAGGTQTLTVSNSKTWTESLADRDFQSQFQYGKWLTKCQFVNRYAFTPDFGTGGDREMVATNYPPRNYCTSTSPGLWTRSSSSGSAYSESVGVKASAILGINLAVTHNYSNSSSTKFTLNYRNSKTVSICGDTDYPSRARKPRI